MDIGEPLKKITVVPLNNPVPDTVKEPPMPERRVKEPNKTDVPEKAPA